MGRFKVLEKKERRIGDKLFLKAERCSSAKCAFIRKPYPPGVHGRRGKGFRNISEFGTQLRSKQKTKLLYGLSERQFKKYVFASLRAKELANAEALVRFLESRLDNVVYRAGFAPSRIVARQIVSHGHIQVNGRKVTIPSAHIRKGDTVSIKESSRQSPLFANLDITLKKFTPEPWIDLDKNAYNATIVGFPMMAASLADDIKSIIEFYSH